ncbi:MAG: GTPase HflX [Gemmatimonadetes bacterium]|nr:GTPase HflX [Gemmatimonadota bacterium]
MRPERAFLVGVALPGTSRSAVDDTLDELALLADTAGAEVIDRAIQERPRFDPAHFVGRGKVDEIKERVEELKIDVVIFDDDLSPAQTRNLETLIDRKIIDRSRLILDIFSSRAQTREAQTQVELAQLTYMLPRLTRQWTHLSRQAGGGGASGGIGTRGPGETQLEVDRRATRSRITALERALDKIVKQRDVGRQGRSGLFSAALVGYTNAGKSTLLRALSGADVFIEDRLFATLDSTTRRVHLGYNRDILLTDTVGFIRKLPHHLIASFRSTLEEAVSADLLLHVVDGGYAHCDEQIETVFEVLTELGIQDRPTLMVFNKLDTVDDVAHRERLASDFPDAVWISAQTGEGLDQLKYAIYQRLEGTRVTLDLNVPQAEGKLLSDLHRVGEVISTQYQGNNVLLTVKLSEENAQRLVPNGRFTL